MPYMAPQQQRQQQQQQQQQQSYPQPPTGMPRIPSSHPQPILPKPAASAEMFKASAGLRYPSNNGGDSLPGQDFASSRMTDQQQHTIPTASPSYGNPPMGRMGPSSEMMAKYGSSQSGYPLGNPPPFPGSLHSRHTPSPNITLGSPLRSVADG